MTDRCRSDAVINYFHWKKFLTQSCEGGYLIDEERDGPDQTDGATGTMDQNNQR